MNTVGWLKEVTGLSGSPPLGRQQRVRADSVVRQLSRSVPEDWAYAACTGISRMSRSQVSFCRRVT